MRSPLLSVLTITTLALAASSMTGCAAEEASPEAEDVADVKKSLLANVGAFELDDKTIVAAPTKVKKLVAAMARPKEGSLRCLPMKYVNILGKDGEKMAELSMSCGTETSSKIEAQLYIVRRDGLADKPLPSPQRYVVQLDTEVVDAVQKEPAAVGDLLFGVDKIEVARMGGKPTTVTSRTALDAVIESLGADQTPREGMQPRCIPDITVNFFRGKTAIGGALACGREGSIRLTRPEVAGAIKPIDVTKLEAVLQGQTK